jgi:hypothetical protein
MPSCCGNSGSDPKSNYFHNLGWIGETGRSHRSSYVYEYSEMQHLWRRVVAPVLSHRYRGVEIYTTLRLATSASSSTPVRERNPMIDLRGVHHRSHIIVTTLLLDRSWAIRGCIGNNILLFAPNTNTLACFRSW